MISRKIPSTWLPSAALRFSTRVTASYSATSGVLPFWRQQQAGIEHALGGWQLNGIVTAMSGTPFTVFDSSDVSEQGAHRRSPDSRPTARTLSPDRIPTPDPHRRCLAECELPSRESPRTPIRRCNNSVPPAAISPLGPRYTNWDFSASKNIRVAESKDFQFRAEFFNLLNHTNFHLPNSDISSPTFNQILAAEPPRLVQFALKFLY